MTGRTWYMSLSVRGAIRDHSRRRPSAKSYINDDNGKSLTNSQAVDALMGELAKGHELLPMGDKCGKPCGHADKGCTGFDYGENGGCPGHPTVAE
jgi:hypothetical protein